MRHITSRIIATSIVAAVLAALCGVAAAQPLEEVVPIADDGLVLDDEVSPELQDRGVLRIGVIPLPADIFREPRPGSEPVSIPIDHGRSVNLVEEKRRVTRTGRTIVVGADPAEPNSRFMMLLEENSLIRGEIRLREEVINLTSPRATNGQLIFRLSVVNPQSIRDEREPITPALPAPGTGGGGVSAHADELASPHSAAAGEPPDEVDPPEPPALPVPTSANPVVVEVMVVYTPQAANEALTNPPFMAIEDMIDQAVEFANYALDDQAGVILNLAWAQPVPYTETGDMREDLKRLACPCDHKIAEVGSNNLNQVFGPWKTHGADIVSLWIHSPNPDDTGIGYVMDPVGSQFAPYAVNVVDWRAAFIGYSFDHEVGHNFGALHDRAQENDVSYDYNYGFINMVLRQATIMAYKSTCESFGFECIRVSNWSDPTLPPPGIWGLASGMLAAHSARTLIENSPTVASFDSKHNLVGCCVNAGNFWFRKWRPGPCP